MPGTVDMLRGPAGSPVRGLVAIGLVCVAMGVAACGTGRGAGAGDLAVTSRSTPARHGAPQTAARRSTIAHHSSTTETSTHQTAQTAQVAVSRVPLRGTSHTLTVPRGWSAELWAHVGDARLEAWTPQGALLVSSPDDGSVVKLTPAKTGAAPRTTTIISGLTDPQGLAFDDLHGREVLYVAESDELDRYRWSADGTPSARTVLVHDLPDTEPAGDDVHRLKNVVVGRAHTIYVDIGSSSNATIPAAVPRGALPRASVLAFDPDGKLKRVWATGVRNGDGLAFAPDGTLWTAVNERDQISFPFHRGFGAGGDDYGKVIPGYVDNHPPDEVARLTPGRDLGWPYCDPDPDATPGSESTALRYGNMPFTPDEQTNPGGHRFTCAKLTPIQRGLPAHSAPLGLTFLEGSTLPARWTAGAVVAAHGSWDRQPPRPPVVYWMPWEAGTRTLGPAIDLVSGFQNTDGSRWGRVADAVPGPDGSLYVTDDQSGAVYRITP